MSTEATKPIEDLLTVGAENRVALVTLLGRTLGETRVEAGRTQTPGVRGWVLTQETVLPGLANTLQRPAPDPTPADGNQVQAPGGSLMRDWNVVVSVREAGYTRAWQLLKRLGPVSRTEYYNVLVMKADDIHRLLEELRARAAEDPSIPTFLGRVMPAARCFDFASHDDFEAKAQEAALAWVPELANKAFHVRMHRRGLKDQLPRPAEERFLDDALLEALGRAGTPGRIRFEDPDAILAVETVGHRAGLGLWTREDLGRYPFLRPD